MNHRKRLKLAKRYGLVDIGRMTPENRDFFIKGTSFDPIPQGPIVVSFDIVDYRYVYKTPPAWLKSTDFVVGAAA